LAAALEVPVTWDERLQEYDIGLLTGVVWAELETLYPDIWQQLRDTRAPVAYPGEEGMEAFQRRVAAFVEDLRGRHKRDQAVGLVSHGGTLSMLVCHVLGVPPRRPQPFGLSNSSLSVLEFRPRGPVLTLLNDTHHLDGLGGRAGSRL
jgi:broad specificity phosphatase PhoE